MLNKNAWEVTGLDGDPAPGPEQTQPYWWHHQLSDLSNQERDDESPKFSFPSRTRLCCFNPDRGVTEANQPIRSLYYIMPFPGSCSGQLFCLTQQGTFSYLVEMLLDLRIPNKNQRSHLTKFIQILSFDSDEIFIF